MVDLHARPPTTPFSERVGLSAVRYMESINMCLFRLSKGRAGGTIFDTPVVLLTTSGRRSGRRYTKPLLALEDGDAWIVVGSRGGTRRNPDWFENLAAYERQRSQGPAAPGAARLEAPVVEAAGADPRPVRAETLRGAERTEWWERLSAVYARFESYQARAPHRQIPVVRLTPDSH